MKNCLFCVAYGVDGDVESFYRRLNFEPWHVFAQRRRDENVKNNMRDVERQTGRTTHALLEAMAVCALEGKVLGITHPVVARVGEYLRMKLELSVPMNKSRRGRSDMIVYEDHHHG